jgi:pyruvate dehydrogenase E1 component beta subunit
VEVIDLRTLVPLDWETIETSVKKTHKVVIAQEAVKRSGYAGEIAAQIMEGVFDYLDAPVKRVAGLNVVPPFSPSLEDLTYPGVKDIIFGVMDVVR